MWFSLNEKVLKEYNEKQIEKFKQIYDESTYNLFVKSKDRLKNNGYSTDIDVYLKGSWQENPSELKNLLNDLDAIVSAKRGRKTTAELEKEWEPKGNYIYYGKYKSYDVYEPLDVEASMSMGVNTGWCTTGRYGHAGHPEFKPNYEDAKTHWNNYTDEGGRFIYLLDSTTHYGKWAILINREEETTWADYGFRIVGWDQEELDLDPNLMYDKSSNFTIYNSEDDECGYIDNSNDFVSGLNSILGENLLKRSIKPYEKIFIFGNNFDKAYTQKTTCVIPNGIQTISKRAFDSSYIDNISIPDSLIILDLDMINQMNAKNNVVDIYLPQNSQIREIKCSHKLNYYTNIWIVKNKETTFPVLNDISEVIKRKLVSSTIPVYDIISGEKIADNLGNYISDIELPQKRRRTIGERRPGKK